MSTAPNYPAPRYIACRIDVSPYCQSDFLARCGGKVYLTGFFDDSVNTHEGADKILAVLHRAATAVESPNA